MHESELQGEEKPAWGRLPCGLTTEVCEHNTHPPCLPALEQHLGLQVLGVRVSSE